MVDDIVELPRPLAGRKNSAVLASYAPMEIPTSPLGNMYGVVDCNRDMPICIGNEFNLLTGKDAPHRYKFIEHADKQIVEYVAVADGSVKSRTTKIFIIFVNHVDKSTLEVKREYCWENIKKAREHFGFKPITVLSENVKDELLTSAGMIYPGLTRMFNWTHSPGSVFADESREVERLMLLRENIKSFNDAWSLDYTPHEGDLFKGCLDDKKPEKDLRLLTASGRTLPYHVLSPEDLMQFKSSRLGLGPYQHCLIQNKEGIGSSVIDGLSEFTGWFDVLKYIEAIPYGEVFAQVTPKSEDVVRVYDPYDRVRYFDVSEEMMSLRAKGIEVPKALRSADEAACLVRDAVVEILGDFKKMSVYRSWGEEVFITIQKRSGLTIRYYFDLFHAVLGTRLLEEREA